MTEIIVLSLFLAFVGMFFFMNKYIIEIQKVREENRNLKGCLKVVKENEDKLFSCSLRTKIENKELVKQVNLLSKNKKKEHQYKAGQQINKHIFLSKEVKVYYKVYSIEKDVTRQISEAEFKELQNEK